MNRPLILTGFVALLSIQPSPAQTVRTARPSAVPAAAAGAHLARIRSVRADAIVTPEIDVRIKSVPTSSAKHSWLRIHTEYDTSETWADDVTITTYALLKAKNREDVGATGKQFNLFKGEVSYMNVPKGKHVSDMYLPPDAFTRFAGGDKAAVEKVAVLITVNGQVVGDLSDPQDRQRWWEQLQPFSQSLLNHAQTPFGLANIDDQHQIKPASR